MFNTKEPSIELGAFTLTCNVFAIAIFLKFQTLPIVGKSGNDITIQDALGERFNYTELMNG